MLPPKTALDRNLTTLLKGVAMLMVLFCHVGNHFTNVFTPLGGIGVALFLCMSGYGLTASFEKSGLKGYWRKRLVGVMLPYALMELVTVPLRGGHSIVANS